jgi:hypothetical protein
MRLSYIEEIKMATKELLRCRARFSVKWPVTYWNEGLFGRGTILDISHVGCQMAGTMPVRAGMILKLWVAPPQGETRLCVEEARVLWSKEYEFGLEFRDMVPDERQWLIWYLDLAERRNSFRNLGELPSKEDLAAMPLALPLRDR